MEKLTVINLRGTSGSGKTYIVKQILAHGNWSRWTDSDGKILGYYNESNRWAIVGSYETPCGGCDTIKTQAEVKSRIYMLLQWGYNVLFEGLVISTITQGWLDFANSIKPQANTMFCYLNTPIETCIQQVRSRRESNGKSPEFNTDNTVNRVKSIQSTRDKLRNSGFWCVEGSSSDILHYLNQFFGIGGNLDV